MKKIIYLLTLIISFSLASCILHASHESNLHNIIKGTWRIENPPYDTIHFTNDGHFCINDTLIGTYVLNTSYKKYY